LNRKSSKSILIFFSLLLSFSITSLAQEDYKTLKAQVVELEKAENFTAAIPVAEKALKQAEVEYGKTNYRFVAALTKLGEIYQGAELFDKAEKVFTEVVALDKAKYGETEMVYAESISHLGLVLYLQGKYDLALPLFIQAAEIKKSKMGVSVLYANALNNVASINFKLGKYPIAETQFTEALSIYQSLESTPSEQHANAKNGLGVLYDMVGRYEDAEALLISAVQWRKQLLGEISLDYAESLRNLAGTFKNMGRYTESEKVHQEALQIVKSRGEKTLNYGNSLYNFALLYLAVGNFRQAENMLKESLSISKTVLGDKSSTYATGLNGLANIYADIGSFTEAETLYKQQIEILKGTLGDEHPHYATALANLGALYYQMGRYEQAESIYLKVLELDRKNFGGNNPESATLLNYLAVLYRDMNKLDASEEYFKKAMEILKNQLGTTHPEYIKTLIGLGDTYIRCGKGKEGIALYIQSLPYFETRDGQASVNYSTFVNNLAVLFKATGDFVNAEKWYKEGMRIQLEQWGETSSSYVRTLANLGELYFAMGQFEKAERLLKKVLATYLKDLQTNFPSMSEREKSQFYKTVSFHFDLFNSFTVTPTNRNSLLLGDMYNNQLATKGMLINAIMQLKNQILRSKDDVLIALYKNWIQKKEQIARAKKLSVAERLKRNVNLEALENEANELERNLSLQSDRFNIAAKQKLFTWQDVQSKLKKDEAAVEIIRFKKYSSKLTVFTDTILYAALIVKPETIENPSLVLLDNGNDLEKKYLKYYRNVIQQQKGGVTIEDKFSYPQFWQRIAEQLKGVKKVYLSVDGFYNQVNLNTLVNPETGKYLIDEIDIELVTNTSDLLKPKTGRGGKKQTASLFGFPNYNMSQGERHVERKKLGISTGEQSELNTVDVRYIASMNTIKELPGTKTEVESIGKILSNKKWETKTLVNNLALEENVKLLQGPTVFHIATHEFFEPDIDAEESKNLKYENALFRSGLLLAGSAETLYKKANALEVGEERAEDGVLTAYEAMNIDLNSTELVVLSACETGLGEVANGEGVYGLQRAFKVAGADAIIFSLWKVDDAATQKLMTNFYNFWLTTGNKRESFTKAQIALREEYKSPYYWGAFVLIGE
jgi:CHAT domain-containing protein/Tfp pilus assembly protein PilF